MSEAWAGETVLTTARLTLRTYRQDDLPVLAALNGDAEVMRFLGGPMSRVDSDAMAARIEARWAADRLGMLGVERSEDGALVGMAGLGETPWFPDQTEVGWRLAPRHWGRGYATEAATGWLEHAFTERGCSRVIAVAAAEPPNLASITVMRRLGMSFDRRAERDHDGELVKVVVHAIRAEQWRTRPDQSWTMS
jgi:RimJ/RimL family protein N-acetyltransferase